MNKQTIKLMAILVGSTMARKYGDVRKASQFADRFAAAVKGKYPVLSEQDEIDIADGVWAGSVEDILNGNLYNVLMEFA